MVACQILTPIDYGWPPTGLGLSTIALNANATWVAFGFMVDVNKTLNSARIYCSTLTGTPTNANDFTCGIYSDSGSGGPGSNMTGGSDQPVNALPAGAGWFQFDGFTASLTAGTIYWVVFKNPNTTDGSATTIFPTYRFFTGMIPNIALVSNSSAASAIGAGGRQTTTNSGSAWTKAGSGNGGFSLIFSDSTYYGFPTQSTATDTTKIFNNGTASIEVGVKFTTPLNAQMNVKGVYFWIGASSSFVGPLVAKLYQGSSTSTCTLLAQSNTFPTGNLGSGGWPQTVYFSSPVTLSANTVYRLVIADTSSTGSSTAYIELGSATFDSSIAGLQALTPFDGTMVKTTTPAGTSTIGGSPATAFTDSAFGEIIPMGLLLDTNGEFTSTGTGTGGFFIQ